MTATTENTRGTALAQVASGVLAQVKDQKPWTVADLVDALAGPAPVIPEAEPFPAPATAVKYSAEIRKALTALPKVFGKVNPGSRRALVPSELELITRESVAINAVTKPLGQRADVISEIMRTHQDVQAEQDGVVRARAAVQGGRITEPASQRIPSGVARGHYLLAAPQKPFETPVEGFKDAWQQRFVSGKPSISPAKLEKLLADGTISRDEYLSFTRETRVLDQEKIAAAIRKDPGRALQVLGAITDRSAGGASLYPPKK